MTTLDSKLDTYMSIYHMSFWILLMVFVVVILHIIYDILPFRIEFKNVTYIFAAFVIIYFGFLWHLHNQIMKLPSFVKLQDLESRKFDYIATNSFLRPRRMLNGALIYNYINKSGAKSVRYTRFTSMQDAGSFSAWASKNFPNKSSSILIVNTDTFMNTEYDLYRRLVADGYTNVSISNL